MVAAIAPLPDGEVPELAGEAEDPPCDRHQQQDEQPAPAMITGTRRSVTRARHCCSHEGFIATSATNQMARVRPIQASAT